MHSSQFLASGPLHILYSLPEMPFYSHLLQLESYPALGTSSDAPSSGKLSLIPPAELEPLLGSCSPGADSPGPTLDCYGLCLSPPSLSQGLGTPGGQELGLTHFCVARTLHSAELNWESSSSP